MLIWKGQEDAVAVDPRPDPRLIPLHRPAAPRSHGTGRFTRAELGRCPDSVVIEEGVLVFHPDRVFLGEDVYVGHQTILKGYYKNDLVVGARSWIGQGCFLHAAGGIRIGEVVGVGPRVSILTSVHEESGPDELAQPIMSGPLLFRPVVLEDGCDIGVASVILPGV